MEIYRLQQEYLFFSLSNTSSFFIRLKQLGDVWLFNCFEGCQHLLSHYRVKISQVKKIFITDNNISNISGLLGLLSSISLNTRTQRIDIYAPKDLHKYIFLGRKYSQTNFRYRLYIHNVSDILTVKQGGFNIYACYDQLSRIYYIILLLEEPGPFNIQNAINYQIPFGPLYGDFKRGNNFILPDGSIIFSQYVIYGYYLGSKIVFLSRLIQKSSISLLNNSGFILYY